MRNASTVERLRSAHRGGIDFSQMVNYGPIWTPLSLKAGDIVRADLKTHLPFKLHGRGELGLDAQKFHNSKTDGFYNFDSGHAGIYDNDAPMKLAPRNTLVLGLDLDLQTYDIRYIRLARFTYDINNRPASEVEPEFFPDQISHFSKPVKFKGRSIDFIPFDTEAIGFACDKVGTLTHRGAMNTIMSALHSSEEKRREEKRREEKSGAP